MKTYVQFINEKLGVSSELLNVFNAIKKELNDFDFKVGKKKKSIYIRINETLTDYYITNYDPVDLEGDDFSEDSFSLVDMRKSVKRKIIKDKTILNFSKKLKDRIADIEYFYVSIQYNKKQNNNVGAMHWEDHEVSVILPYKGENKNDLTKDDIKQTYSILYHELIHLYDVYNFPKEATQKHRNKLHKRHDEIGSFGPQVEAEIHYFSNPREITAFSKQSLIDMEEWFDEAMKRGISTNSKIYFWKLKNTLGYSAYLRLIDAINKLKNILKNKEETIKTYTDAYYKRNDKSYNNAKMHLEILLKKAEKAKKLYEKEFAKIWSYYNSKDTNNE